jgi:hypothetical protein
VPSPIVLRIPVLGILWPQTRLRIYLAFPPAIIAALCPKFEALNDDSLNKTIDGTLRLLQQRDDHLFFWVIEYKRETSKRVTAKQIEEMRRYGIVKALFEGRKMESKARARLFRSWL